jgi:hypothetical protein
VSLPALTSQHNNLSLTIWIEATEKYDAPSFQMKTETVVKGEIEVADHAEFG